jgi:hypothetical protein
VYKPLSSGLIRHAVTNDDPGGLLYPECGSAGHVSRDKNPQHITSIKLATSQKLKKYFSTTFLTKCEFYFLNLKVFNVSS